MGRGDLSNEQWPRWSPLLPTGIKPGRPPKWTKRQLIDGVRWRTRTGAPWRDVPARYGPWQTVYGLFRRWQRDGTWTRILSQLQAQADARGLITWEVNVDTTIARATSTPPVRAEGGAATRRTRQGSDIEPADHGLGRSRGGLTSRLHLAVEQGQRPLSIVVTAGQRGDAPQFAAVAVLPARLPQAARGGVRHQPAQAAPGGGHPLRQARRALPGHRADRRDQ
jgi:transposase